ncbi:MAG: DEAD/DEAH box helicase [Bacteroidaceae bacterium]|nr:DEAD/DEAH box helicase [Bacteroidaceae bacterium]
MARFQVGSKVIRVDTQKKGTISFVSDYIRGRQYYIVNWGDYESEELETELIEDCDISNVFERCKRGLFGSYSEFAQKNTSSKIQSSNNSTISSLKASKTLFKTYQFKPLLKFINSPSRRLLVADEVGLGKTIEAGHIMLELKARRELRDVLIVCPKSLQVKWKEELKEKFGLFFKIYESSKDLIADFENINSTVRAIINYEKIRLVDTDSKNKEKSKSKLDSKQKLSVAKNIPEYLRQSDRPLSFVLCDEAHKMRNSNTQTYKGAKIVMEKAKSAVFLTATPIMISTENLYNLLHLLDSTKYFNYQIFNARLQENVPFVKAITALNHHVPLQQIEAQLINEEIKTTFINKDKDIIYNRRSSVEDVYKNDPIFQEIIERTHSDDTKKNRARLQYLLNSMSVMNNIFSRTRKRDVNTDMSQAQRKPKPQKIVLTNDEQIEFDNVIHEYTEDNSYIDYWGEEKLTPGGVLGLIQKKRQVASSVYAYLNTEEDLDRGVDLYEDKTDSKVERLVEIINEVFNHGTHKIVIFANFRKTLKYLNLRLAKKGFKCLMIHGLINDRAEILDNFKNDPQNHILLSSEVGSEGLDMQFCNSMVNYDLPWNPMVVEQRIGRIDRFGQKSPVVNIYNFIVAGSIQEIIYMRLLERIGLFRETIGDMEAILDSPISEGSTKTIQDVYNQLERELYTSELSEEELNERLEEIGLAYEKERQSIEELEKGLTDSLTNDAYFKEEIDRIRNNNAYVTEEELKNYLETVIEKHLTTCNLIDCGNQIYELVQPLSDKKVLSRFLSNYHPGGKDSDIALRRFQYVLEEKERILVTFNQDMAYNNHSLFFLNIYHPIIQACLKYFNTHSDEINKTFCYALHADDLLIKGASFYMCLYKYITTRMVQGVLKKSETLLPFVYNIETNALEEEDVSNRLYSVSQIEGYEYNPSESLYTPNLIDEMRLIFLDASTKERKSRISELKKQVESERQHNEIQTREFYNIRIDTIRQRIKNREDILEFLTENTAERQNLERLIKMDKGLLDSHMRELQEKLDIINENPQIDIDCMPVSLTLITIV